MWNVCIPLTIVATHQGRNVSIKAIITLNTTDRPYILYIKYVGISCPATFTNGQVSSGCNRYVGSICGVKLIKRDNNIPIFFVFLSLIYCIYNILNFCLFMMMNMSHLRLLCLLAHSGVQHILCCVFVNGQVSSGCNRYVGSTCGVKCDDGFNAHISSLVCNDNGQWNTDVSIVKSTLENIMDQHLLSQNLN
jgi:hypothetical protein